MDVLQRSKNSPKTDKISGYKNCEAAVKCDVKTGVTYSDGLGWHFFGLGLIHMHSWSLCMNLLMPLSPSPGSPADLDCDWFPTAKWCSAEGSREEMTMAVSWTGLLSLDDG